MCTVQYSKESLIDDGTDQQQRTNASEQQERNNSAPLPCLTPFPPHSVSHQCHCRVGCYTSVFQLLSGIIFILLKGIHSEFPPVAIFLLVGSGILHGLHLLLLRGTAGFSYSKHRTAVVVLLLLLIRLLTALTIPYAPTDANHGAKLLYKTGLIPLIW